MEPKMSENSEEVTQLTVKQAGARGGSRTLERHGREHFQAIGRKGGKRTAKLYRELLSNLARGVVGRAGLLSMNTWGKKLVNKRR